MSSPKHCMAVAALAILSGLAGSSPADAPVPQSGVQIRRTQEQVVLYTIHRGPLDGIGEAIGKLIGEAVPKGLYPRGSISLAYLNDFKTLSSDHWLTEIRIPVAQEALSHAGTLGAFTDVKRLPAVDVVIAAKPQGMNDTESVYMQLHAWIHQHDYWPTEGASEVFLDISMDGDYSKMQSEIMIPIRKIARAQ